MYRMFFVVLILLQGMWHPVYASDVKKTGKRPRSESIEGDGLAPRFFPLQDALHDPGRVKKSVLEGEKSEIYLSDGKAYYKKDKMTTRYVENYFLRLIQDQYRYRLVVEFLTDYYVHQADMTMLQYQDLCRAITPIQNEDFRFVGEQFKRLNVCRQVYYPDSYTAMMAALLHVPLRHFYITVDILTEIIMIEDHVNFHEDLPILLKSLECLDEMALCQLPKAIFDIKMQPTILMQQALNARKDGSPMKYRKRYSWLPDAFQLAESRARALSPDLLADVFSSLTVSGSPRTNE